MMAWENFKESINENENESEDYNSSKDRETVQKNLIEEEEADDEFSESSSSTDYDHQNKKEFKDNILLPGNTKTEPQFFRLRNWKEIPRRN